MTLHLCEQLKQLVVGRLDVKLPATDIDELTPLFDGGLELDSFAIIELITLIEKSYGFEFSDGDLRPENFANLRSLGELVARRGANDAPGQPAG